MIVLTYEMLLPSIKDARLKALIEDDLSILDEAEATAVSIVRDALSARYNIDEAFSQAQNDPKYRFLARHLINITLYLLYERLPDRMAPERITNDYDRTLKTLEDLGDGKRSSILPGITADPDGDGYPDTTKFRWGSLPGRTH